MQNIGLPLRVIADEIHQSCALITSRENPVGLTLRQGHQSPVRSLQVSGLAIAEVQQLLLSQNISITEVISEQLVHEYGGNPFALKTLATTIKSLFAGNVSQCLSQTRCVYGEIRRLLEPQIQRLTPSELQILEWIAMQPPWVCLETVQNIIARDYQLSQSIIWDSLQSLQGRSLIESGTEGFNLHPFLRKYLLEDSFLT